MEFLNRKSQTFFFLLCALSQINNWWWNTIIIEVRRVRGLYLCMYINIYICVMSKCPFGNSEFWDLNLNRKSGKVYGIRWLCTIHHYLLYKQVCIIPMIVKIKHASIPYSIRFHIFFLVIFFWIKYKTNIRYTAYDKIHGKSMTAYWME